jgi:serine/tyrosine/threonine adenylyltransferase
MRAKLGLRAALPDDEAFIGATFAFLQRQRPDFTLFFCALSNLPTAVDPESRVKTDAPLRDLIVDRAAADAWLAEWRGRLAQTPWDDGERQAAMRMANPKYVLRNWLAELAIRKAREKDFAEVARLLACLRRPCAEQPEFSAYAAPAPDWASGLEVSCSS